MDMALNTRFAPSPNAFIHLGHVFMAKVNYDTAKANGAYFYIRVHDDEISWAGSGYIEKVVIDMVEVFDKFGVVADDIFWESRENALVERIARDIIPCASDEVFMQHDMFSGRHEFHKVRYINTLYGVVSDYMHGCGMVIRGEDLKPENHLYWFLCDTLAIPKPNMYYIPRIRVNGYPIAKSAGTPSASVLVNEYGVDGLDFALREGCLLDPDGTFDLANIKPGALEVQLDATVK